MVLAARYFVRERATAPRTHTLTHIMFTIKFGLLHVEFDLLSLSFALVIYTRSAFISISFQRRHR